MQSDDEAVNSVNLPVVAAAPTVAAPAIAAPASASTDIAAVELMDVCKVFSLHSFKHRFDAKTSRDKVIALDHVSFSIMPGETFALVGESGSGKTTTGRIIAGLEKADSGEISIFGNRRDASRAAKQTGDVQFVFQDPFSALDPRWRVGATIEEPLIIAGDMGRQERMQRIEQLAEAIGLSGELLQKYPHELSGGQRQRVNIARALVGYPRVVILDEPVSALDVSIQAQVLNLLKDLQEQLDTTFIFISHDMSVVRFIASRAAVMHHGRVVEMGAVEQILSDPQDPYTVSLINAIPKPPQG